MVIENPVAYESAIKRNIISNARKTFLRTVDDAEALIDFLVSKSGKNNSFCDSLLHSLDSYGKLTEKQCEAIRNSMHRETEMRAKWAADNAAKNATRKYLGEVGKKIEITLTVKSEFLVEKPKFHYYDSSFTCIRICEDADGNVIVFSGTASFPNKGQTATITATVKTHRDYKGTPQTVISRPKIITIVE